MSKIHQHLAFAALALTIPVAGMAATDTTQATAADKAFVAKVAQGGMLEVQAGKLAEEQASAQDVKDFGAMEAHDHQLVNEKLTSIANDEQIDVASKLDAKHQKMLDQLKNQQGQAFDQAYMSMMETLHEGDGAAFAKEGKEGGSEAFRQFGQESATIVQRHLGALRAAAPPSKS